MYKLNEAYRLLSINKAYGHVIQLLSISGKTVISCIDATTWKLLFPQNIYRIRVLSA